MANYAIIGVIKLVDCGATANYKHGEVTNAAKKREKVKNDRFFDSQNGRPVGRPIFCKNSSGVVRRIAEQQRDAPQTGDAHQGIDNAADGSQLAAADKGHAVKGEQSHAAPVQRTDDDQDQSNAIHNLHDGFPPFPKKIRR